MLKRLITVSLLTLGALASLWPAAAQTSALPQYYVTDLGLLPNVSGSSAQAINDQGCVVGYVPADQSGGNRGGWLWTPNPADPTQGTLAPLKPVQAPPSSCIATDINGEGLIVGQSSGGATCWTAPDAPLDFNTVLLNPDGWKLVSAWAVSDPGPAGEVYVAGTGLHASAPTTSVGLVWCFSGGVITSLTPLEIPPDSTYVGVKDINSLGQMAGSAVSSTYAHRWEANGQRLVLGTFGGTTVPGEGINEDGAVVGWTPSLDRGWVWTPTTATTGTLTILSAPVDNRSKALAINNASQIVGDAVFMIPARKPYAGRRACLWQNGQAHNLNSLKTAGAVGLELLEATSINNQGSIIARYNSTKGSRAVLLTPR